MYYIKHLTAHLFAISLLLTSNTVVADAENGLTLGIHPYLHATTLVERFTPLTEYLSKTTGKHIHIRVGTSYQDHIDAVNQGEVDFAYFGPAGYIKATELNENIVPLGRLSFAGRDTFRGVITIRRDSKITSLSELKGKSFAFGDPNSTLSNLVPQRLLNDVGIDLTDLDSYSHLKNHHNVALAVLMGKYHAGGIKEEVFREYEARGLKALKWTPDVPTHIFVAGPTTKRELIDELIPLLQNLHKQSGAALILNKIKKGATAIIPATSQEYDKLRALISDRPLLEQRKTAP
ncbi:phosphate/phosphite/phosphonate ABC transporter substrate-binding protein [Candidatus Reidiella endopervernicosa]|nr:phosphate/phosphite/phosphonate ABC transporter substrate-binding protein [Candidatus Reidiella endopervernicosa]QKQ27119.1 phosphate/phosphite/phosphonate ABC transporter substrate-binding protein [Candidatus Reidiella endopervernicosa]